MARNVYARGSSMSKVNGRIDYISNHNRQEHMEAFVSSVPEDEMNQWWLDYARHCQIQGEKFNNTDYENCEGREFVLKLSNDYVKFKTPIELAAEISEELKNKSNTENVVAIHWNKSRKNYHAHVIMAEAIEINEIKYGAIEKRNRYYDENGKQSTKQKCIDPETNQLRPGCQLVKKGHCKETFKRWGTKLEMGSIDYSAEIKQWLADKQNADLKTKEYQVYKEDGMHLPTQHVGNKIKGHLKQQIENKNQIIREWNEVVDQSLLVGVDEDFIKNQRDEFKKQLKSTKDQSHWRSLISNATQYFKINVIELTWNKLQELSELKRDKDDDIQKTRNDISFAKKEISALKNLLQQHTQLYAAIEQIRNSFSFKKKKEEQYRQVESQHSDAALDKNYYDRLEHTYNADLDFIKTDIDKRTQEAKETLTNDSSKLKELQNEATELKIDIDQNLDYLDKHLKHKEMKQLAHRYNDLAFRKGDYNMLLNHYDEKERIKNDPELQKQIKKTKHVHQMTL